MNTPQIYFDHEKLVAYQRSIQFVAWANQILENVSSKLAVHDQLDRASTSVPFGILPAVEPGFQPGGTTAPPASNRLELHQRLGLLTTAPGGKMPPLSGRQDACRYVARQRPFSRAHRLKPELRTAVTLHGALEPSSALSGS